MRRCSRIISRLLNFIKFNIVDARVTSCIRSFLSAKITIRRTYAYFAARADDIIIALWSYLLSRLNNSRFMSLSSFDSTHIAVAYNSSQLYLLKLWVIIVYILSISESCKNVHVNTHLSCMSSHTVSTIYDHDSFIYNIWF